MINFKRYIRNYNLILNIIYWYGVFIFIHCRCWQSFNSNNIICRALMWLFHVRLFWIPWKMPRHAQSWVWIKVLRLNKTTDGWQLLVWLVVWIFFYDFPFSWEFFHHPNCYFHSMIFQRGRYTKPPSSSRTVHFCWPRWSRGSPEFSTVSCNELVFDHR